MQFHRTLRPLAVCAMIGLCLSGCNSPEEKEARAIRRGDAYFQNGAYEKARIEYKNALQAKPLDAEPVYSLGLVDEAEGNLRNAFTNFMAAEQQNKHFLPATIKIAQYLISAEQYTQARERLQAVLSEQPTHAEAHALSASILSHENNVVDAEKEAQLALSQDAANITACAVLTGIYTNKKEFDKAISTVNDGLARNPQNIPLLLLRATVYNVMGDLAKVNETYQIIFKLKPELSQFRAELAEMYVKTNKSDEAEAILREGVTALPNDWEMKHELISFLSTNRGLNAAEKEIKDLIAANPKKDDLYFWLADAYINHQSPEQALALLDQIVERGQYNPSALNARTQLARLHFKQGNRDLAEKLVATVLANSPDNPEALYIKANLEYENGYYQSAISDLRTIVRDEPQNREALQLLSETLLTQGHTDLAIDTLAKLVDFDPANITARIRLAQMLQANGDKEKANAWIAEVTKIAPENPIAWETTARIAIDSQKWLVAEEAIRILDKMTGEHPTAAFLEGQVLETNNKNDEAIQKYTEAVNNDPNTPLAERALASLTRVHDKLGHINVACSYLESLKSESPFVATLLGQCYKSSGHNEESVKLFDKAIANKATFQDPYLNRAELYVKEHKPEQAIDTLKLAASIAPSDLRATMMAANLLGATGHYADAAKLYQDILDRDAGNDMAANNLAELIADYQYTDTAALEKARKIAERFTGSTDPNLLDTLAWVYYRQGNVQMAQTILERALQKQGAELPAQLHYHYAAILLKGGKATDRIRSELQLATPNNADYPELDKAKQTLNEISK